MSKSKGFNLISKTFQLIFFSFLVKGLGFLREMVLAYFYGTSAVSDVYVAVQNIPSIIFTVFGTAVTTGFIPIYTDVCVNKGKEEADRFANNIFNIFFVLSIILSIVGILFSKYLVKIFAGGFTGETYILCDQFAKIIMPTCIPIILCYVYNAYLQIEGSYNQHSLMNVPYNIIQMLMISIGFYTGTNYILAVGLLLASFSQLLYLRIIIKKRTTFKHSKILNFKDLHIRSMLVIVGPMFISTGVNQLNTIVDKSMASGLIEGSVAALNYSGEVANIVTQVIILSLTTILYPQMTRLFSEKNGVQTSEFINKYLCIVSILVIPLAALIFCFSEEIVQILFGRGAFDYNTVLFVSKALRIYAIGIVGASFRDVLNKVFYSMKNTIIPMTNGVIAVVFNIALNFILIGNYAYLGLATATTVSATVCTILMYLQLCRKVKELDNKNIILEFIKSLLGAAVMLILIYALNTNFTVESAIIKCFLFGGAAVAVYLIMLIILKEKFVYDIFNKIKAKIKCN